MQLATSGTEHPRWIAVDFGCDDMTTECEVELLPDGTFHILDMRETPNPRNVDAK